MAGQDEPIPLGELIRQARLRQNMTQDDLADAIGAPRAYISQVESGRTQWPARYIGKLSTALGLRPSELGRAAGRIVRDEDFSNDERAAEAASARRASSRPVSGGDLAAERVMAIVRDLSPRGRAMVASYAAFVQSQEAGRRDPSSQSGRDG